METPRWTSLRSDNDWPKDKDSKVPESLFISIEECNGAQEGPYTLLQHNLDAGVRGEYARLLLVLTLDSTRGEVVLEKAVLILSPTSGQRERGSIIGLAEEIDKILGRLDLVYGDGTRRLRRRDTGEVRGFLTAVVFTDLGKEESPDNFNNWSQLIYHPSYASLLPYFKRRKVDSVWEPLTYIVCHNISRIALGIQPKDERQLIVSNRDGDLEIYIKNVLGGGPGGCKFAKLVTNKEDLLGLNVFNLAPPRKGFPELDSQKDTLRAKFFSSNGDCLNGEKGLTAFAPRLYIIANDAGEGGAGISTACVHRVTDSETVFLSLFLDSPSSFKAATNIFLQVPRGGLFGAAVVNLGHVPMNIQDGEAFLNALLSDVGATGPNVLAVQLESMDSYDGHFVGSAKHDGVALVLLSILSAIRYDRPFLVSSNFCPMLNSDIASETLQGFSSTLIWTLVYNYPNLFLFAHKTLSKLIIQDEFEENLNPKLGDQGREWLDNPNMRKFLIKPESLQGFFTEYLSVLQKKFGFVPEIGAYPEKRDLRTSWMLMVTGDFIMSKEGIPGFVAKPRLPPLSIITPPRATVQSLSVRSPTQSRTGMSIAASPIMAQALEENAVEQDLDVNSDDFPTPYVHTLTFTPEGASTGQSSVTKDLSTDVVKSSSGIKPLSLRTSIEIPRKIPDSTSLSYGGLFVFSKFLDLPVLVPGALAQSDYKVGTKEWHEMTTPGKENPYIDYLKSIHTNDRNCRVFAEVDKANNQFIWNKLLLQFSIGQSTQVFVNSSAAYDQQVGKERPVTGAEKRLVEPGHYVKEGLLVLARDGNEKNPDRPPPSSKASFSWAEVKTFLDYKPPVYLGAFINDNTKLVVDDGTPTVPGHNLIWLWPLEKKRVEYRLCLKLSPNENPDEVGLIGNILGVISQKPNLVDSSSFRIIAKKTVETGATPNTLKVTSSVDIMCQVQIPNHTQIFHFILSLTPESTTVRIQTDPAARAGNLGAVLSWLEDLAGADSNISSQKDLEDESSLFFEKESSKVSLDFVQVALTLKEKIAGGGAAEGSTDASKPKTELSLFELDMEAMGVIGSNPQKVSALLCLKWEDGKKSFTGSLWDMYEIKKRTAVPANLFLAYEPFLEIKCNENARKSFDVAEFLSDDVGLPTFLPTRIVSFYLEIASDGVTFMAVMGAVPTKELEPGEVTMVRFTSLRLRAKITFDRQQSKRNISFSFSGDVTLGTKNPAKYPPALLNASIAYAQEQGKDAQSKELKLVGSAKDLRMAHFFSLFKDSAEAAAVMDFMDAVVVKEFTITYVFTSKTDPKKPEVKVPSSASKFDVEANVIIGKLALLLKMSTTGDKFDLTASLQPDVKQVELTNIGALIRDVSGSSADILPDFIADMAVKPGSGVELAVSKQTPEGQDAVPFLVFDLRLVLPHLDITLVQHQLLQKKNTPAGTTRLLRVAFNGFPTAPPLPLIGELTPTFDQVQFLWANENVNGKTLDQLNTTVLALNKLLVKEIAESGSGPEKVAGTDANKIKLKKGCHLMVVATQKGNAGVLIDYAFGGGENQTSPPKTLPPDETPTGDVNEEKPGDEKPAVEAPTEKKAEAKGEMVTAPLQQNKGPLSIKNISFGLSTKEQSFSIKLDATFEFGPVSMELLGLSIKVSNIKDWQSLELKPGLEGMAISYIQPPMVLLGVFRSANGIYSGGLVLTFPPYSLLAMGEYRERTPVSPESMYVLAILNGPLAQLEVCEISGVQAGFGYNSALTIPSAAQVNSHPFLADIKPDSATALVKTLTSGGTWFPPEDGTYWVAAGMRIKAMQTLDVKAILAVQFGSSLQISVFAQAGAEAPAPVAGSKAFVSVKLGMVGTLNVEKGIFKVEGQLAPSSYIFHESCKLVGGFAVAFWFKGSEYEGDWVFSIGGYHPAYVKPAHYPVVNSLVGISWQYSPEIKIEGGAYFAVTPKCLMGGGRLTATLKKNNIAGGMADIDATFKAWADFLINYHPFHYMGEIGASIYARVKIDWGLLTSTFVLDLSGVLKVQGPDFAGSLVIKGIPIIKSATVKFGPKVTKPPPLQWEDFAAMIIQPTKEDATTHTIILAEGTIEDTTDKEGEVKEKTSGDAISVRCGAFVLGVQSKFPISTYTVTSGNQPHVGYGDAIHFKPMQAYEETSSMTVSINGSFKFTSAEVTKNEVMVPTALWDQYSSANDPSKGSRALLGTSTKSLLKRVTGLTISTPKPNSVDSYIALKVEYPWIEFKAMVDVHLDVFGSSKSPVLPEHTVSEEANGPKTLADEHESLADLKAVWGNGLKPIDSRAVVDTWMDIFHKPVATDAAVPIAQGASAGLETIPTATDTTMEPMKSLLPQAHGPLNGSLPTRVTTAPEEYYLDLPRVSQSPWASWRVLASSSWKDIQQKRRATLYLHTGDWRLREAELGDDGEFRFTKTFVPIQLNPGGHVATLNFFQQYDSHGWYSQTLLVFWEYNARLYCREQFIDESNGNFWADVDIPLGIGRVLEGTHITAVPIGKASPEGRLYAQGVTNSASGHSSYHLKEFIIWPRINTEELAIIAQGATLQWPLVPQSPLSAVALAQPNSGELAEIQIFCLATDAGNVGKPAVGRWVNDRGGWLPFSEPPPVRGSQEFWCAPVPLRSGTVPDISILLMPIHDQGGQLGGTRALLVVQQGGLPSGGRITTWRYINGVYEKVADLGQENTQPGSRALLQRLLAGLTWPDSTTSPYAGAHSWLWLDTVAQGIKRVEWKLDTNDNSTESLVADWSFEKLAITR